MNIFIIPSWYPSKSNPLNGIQIKEQTLLIANYYSDINFGISRWGQNDEDYLLYSQQPLKSLRKFRQNNTYDNCLYENVWEFFSPAYSWHQWIKQGNIKSKIRACFQNLKRFEDQFGKVNIIHAHVSYPGGYIAQQLSAMTDIPYIITERMGPFPQKYHLTRNGKLKPEIKQAIINSNAFVAVSDYLKKDIEAKEISKPIAVIPNFTDPQLFREVSIKKGTSFSFITASGMLNSKGIPELLEAISLVSQKNKSVHFMLVGDGPDLVKLKKKADDLRITDLITWTGFQPREQMSQYFFTANAHILCSHYESFGVCYIEAMATGLPNIATAIGGPLDIIDEETGVFVKEVDPALIAEKILWLTENYHRFDPRIIRKSFEQRFSVEAVAPKIRSLYESLL